jgi:hypothetical protein
VTPTKSEIILKLPKTKDGFTIYPGMCVWYLSPNTSVPVGVFVCLVGKDYVTTGNGAGFDAKDIYGDRNNATKEITDGIMRRIEKNDPNKPSEGV